MQGLGWTRGPLSPSEDTDPSIFTATLGRSYRHRFLSEESVSQREAVTHPRELFERGAEVQAGVCLDPSLGLGSARARPFGGVRRCCRSHLLTLHGQGAWNEWAGQVPWGDRGWQGLVEVLAPQGPRRTRMVPTPGTYVASPSHPEARGPEGQEPMESSLPNSARARAPPDPARQG